MLKKASPTTIGVITLMLGLGIAGFKNLDAILPRSAALHSEVSSRFTAARQEEKVPVRGLDLKRGDQLRYALVYSGQVPGSKTIPKVFEVSVEGNLLLTVLDVEKSGFNVWVQLEEPIFSSATVLPAALQLSLQEAFTAGAPFHLGQRGFDLTLLFSSELSHSSKFFWERLALQARVKVPEYLGSDHYLASEEKAQANGEARYVLPAGLLAIKDETSPIHLQKTLTRGGSSQSESSIVLGPLFGSLVELQQQSQEQLKQYGQELSITSALGLRALDQKHVTELNSFEDRLNKLLAGGSPKSSDSSVQEAALQGVSWKELWGSLKSDELPQETYLKLKAWIELHPHDLSQVLTALQPLAASDARLRSLIKALAAAGHEQAQEALVNLLDARSGELLVQKHIVTSLGLLALPGVAAEKAVERILLSGEEPSLVRSAQVAYGMMGGSLRAAKGQTARSAEIERKSLEILENATNAEARKNSLEMLGQLGPSKSASLGPFLQSPDMGVRAQAYFALRQSPDPESSQVLVKAYGKETDLEVRRQILQALYYREPDTAWFESLKELLENPIPLDDQLFLARAVARHAQKDPRQSASLFSEIESKIPAGTPAREKLEKLQHMAARSLQQTHSFN